MTDSTSPTAPLLQLRGVSKSFPGVRALANVDFTLRRGEIHALMGENGAGKSTLIKVLTGVYPRESGQMELEGRPINPTSPQAAEMLGIGTVYQEVNLIPHLSVAENIALGRQPTWFGCLRWREINRRACQSLERLGVPIDVSASLAFYSIAIQQLVAIARALDCSAKVLILDEPTSSLDTNEVEQLFSVLRKLKADGLGIIFVTHFLEQVYAVSDRITVLRNGQLIGEYETSSLPRAQLVARMIGREISDPTGTRPLSETTAAHKSVPFLSARGMARKNSIERFDLDISRGEVVGLAGLLGSGRTEMARLLFGVDRPDSGELHVEERRQKVASPRESVRLRFGFCPEDRKREGIIPNLSVRQNMILALQARLGWLTAISQETQKEIAEKYIRSLNIVPPDSERPIKFLSGGNQQKVLLARWLAAEPKLLILDEPTRGIDVGAKFEIEKLIRELAAKGMAILFISSELDEVVRNSHRVIVLQDRKKVADLSGQKITEANIMHAIAAAHAQEVK